MQHPDVIRGAASKAGGHLRAGVRMPSRGHPCALERVRATLGRGHRCPREGGVDPLAATSSHREGARSPRDRCQLPSRGDRGTRGRVARRLARAGGTLARARDTPREGRARPREGCGESFEGGPVPVRGHWRRLSIRRHPGEGRDPGHHALRVKRARGSPCRRSCEKQESILTLPPTLAPSKRRSRMDPSFRWDNGEGRR